MHPLTVVIGLLTAMAASDTGPARCTAIRIGPKELGALPNGISRPHRQIDSKSAGTASDVSVAPAPALSRARLGQWPQYFHGVERVPDECAFDESVDVRRRLIFLACTEHKPWNRPFGWRALIYGDRPVASAPVARTPNW
jgi:hypothetical protein